MGNHSQATSTRRALVVDVAEQRQSVMALASMSSVVPSKRSQLERSNDCTAGAPDGVSRNHPLFGESLLYWLFQLLCFFLAVVYGVLAPVLGFAPPVPNNITCT